MATPRDAERDQAEERNQLQGRDAEEGLRPATTDPESPGLTEAGRGGEQGQGLGQEGEKAEPERPHREGYCRRSPSTSPGSGPGSPAAAASSCSSTNLFSSNSSMSTLRKREDSVFRAMAGARRPPSRLGSTPLLTGSTRGREAAGPHLLPSSAHNHRPPTSGPRRNRKLLWAG